MLGCNGPSDIFCLLEAWLDQTIGNLTEKWFRLDVSRETQVWVLRRVRSLVY
jgi:hypothetical protein